MLAVKGNINKIAEAVQNFSGITVANWNSNNQVVLAGTSPEIAKVQQILDELGLYRERNRVERLINRLKQYRRIATRYEKYAVNYMAMLMIGAIRLWL